MRKSSGHTRISGIWCFFYLLIGAHVVVESCLRSCRFFEDFRGYIGCHIEMKARQCAEGGVLFIFFFILGGFVIHSFFPHVRTFFIHCFPDSNLMESGQEIFSGELSTLPNHLVTDLSHSSVYFPVFLPRRLSSHTSLTCHLPVKTFTIEPLSFAPIAPFLLSHALSTSSSTPCATLPWYWSCLALNYFARVWLKCSPWRNKICEENFMVSAPSSWCTDSLCCCRRGLCFIFFPLSTPGGFWLQSPCFSLGVSGSRHGSSHCWII